MNKMWFKVVAVIFLSAVILMGCNNTEDPIEDPADVTDIDNIDNEGPNIEDPVEDPADAVDPDPIDDVDPNTEDPVEDPADADDPDPIDD